MISEERPVRVDRPQIRPENEDLLRHRVEQLAQFAFLPADRLLGFLPVLNIDARTIPAHDSAHLVAQWEGTGHEPAVARVRPPHAYLILVWFPGGEVRDPFLLEPYDVVGMHGGEPAPIPHMSRPDAEIDPSLIHVVDDAVGARAPEHPGDRVD